MKETLDLKIIMNRFNVEDRFVQASPYGTGHLHDTYCVEMKGSGSKTAVYILQRINHLAFARPMDLMDNIIRISKHIKAKLEEDGFSSDEIMRRVLTVVETRDSKLLYQDDSGNYWRVYHFIDNTCSYDVVHSPELLYQVAFKFGEFLAMLEDLPGPALHEGIPGFHDGSQRLEAFIDALQMDSHNRAASARESIEFVQSMESLFDVLPKLLASGKIPVRVTHNDTKVNNVLLDEDSGQGLCVIDLDTAMPGVTAYDFGDLVRTALSTKVEDEQDLSGVVVELPRFKVIVDGFLTGTGSILTPPEIEYLIFSTKLMPLLIGMRFLTDYLSGDIYFKTHRPGQNLDRARRQLKLAQSIIEWEDEMNRVIEDWFVVNNQE